MALCPRCKTSLSVKQLMSGALICRSCGQSLRFPPAEYKQVTQPGIYIALFIIMNMVIDQEHRTRFLINIALVALWFLFFKRFLDYLNQATLEIEDVE